MRTILHQAIENNWVRPQDLGNQPTTLVLGSFNPHSPEDNNSNLDYYYGRRTNYFWKSIANGLGFPDENYFTDSSLEENLRRKTVILERYRFCCLDVIDRIEINCQDEEILENFVKKKIYGELSDQLLFTSDTLYDGHLITIRRIYNPRIVQFIRNSETINSIINNYGDTNPIL